MRNSICKPQVRESIHQITTLNCCLHRMAIDHRCATFNHDSYGCEGARQTRFKYSEPCPESVLSSYTTLTSGFTHLTSKENAPFQRRLLRRGQPHGSSESAASTRAAPGSSKHSCGMPGLPTCRLPQHIPGYVKNWTTADAFRELYQNWYASISFAGHALIHAGKTPLWKGFTSTAKTSSRSLRATLTISQSLFPTGQSPTGQRKASVDARWLHYV